MQKRISLVEIAHERVAAHLKPGAVAIDATVGNGHDTLFLLQQVMPGGRVYGFDVQRPALAAAQARIARPELRAGLILFHDSHAAMAERMPAAEQGAVAAVMFNLGYLPGSDKTVTTVAESTLAALDAALHLLSPAGIVTVIAYPGHAGGKQETECVACWCEGLDTQRFCCAAKPANAHDPSAPILFAITPKG